MPTVAFLRTLRAKLFSRLPTTFFGRLGLALALAAAFFILDVGRYLVWPWIGSLETENPGVTSFMEYRLDEAEDAGKKLKLDVRYKPLSAISKRLSLAVTISEDDKFWDHEGFDFESMEAAFEKNLKAGKIRAGGSTITQQLAKNLWFGPEKSYLRKLKEAIMAWRLERELSKKRILELYLNVVEWGDGIFGAEAAARRYFGVSAKGLSSSQAARLAAVLPSPRRWNPAGNGRVVSKRTRIILGRMQRRGGG
jgi:monofunctional glycosyltransferase